MKRIICIFCLVSMLFGLAACEYSGNTTGGVASSSSQPDGAPEVDSAISEAVVNPSSEAVSELPQISYEEVYRAYKANEIAAKKTYEGNRYRIQATIAKIDADGIWTLGGLLGGAMVEMEVDIDDDLYSKVKFKAEFNRDQEENLSNVSVGDTVLFEGECSGGGLFTECELVVGS